MNGNQILQLPIWEDRFSKKSTWPQLNQVKEYIFSFYFCHPSKVLKRCLLIERFFFGLLKLNYIGFVFSEYLFDGEFLLRPPQAFHIHWNDPHEETSCTLALQVIKFCTSYLFFCIKSGSISASAIQSPLGFHRSCGVNLFLLKYTYLIGVGKCSISLFGTMLTFSATSRSGVSISAKLLNCAWL